MQCLRPKRRGGGRPSVDNEGGSPPTACCLLFPHQRLHPAAATAAASGALLLAQPRVPLGTARVLPRGPRGARRQPQPPPSFADPPSLCFSGWHLCSRGGLEPRWRGQHASGPASRAGCVARISAEHPHAGYRAGVLAPGGGPRGGGRGDAPRTRTAPSASYHPEVDPEQSSAQDREDPCPLGRAAAKLRGGLCVQDARGTSLLVRMSCFAALCPPAPVRGGHDCVGPASGPPAGG